MFWNTKDIKRTARAAAAVQAVQAVCLVNENFGRNQFNNTRSRKTLYNNQEINQQHRETKVTVLFKKISSPILNKASESWGLNTSHFTAITKPVNVVRISKTKRNY